MAKLWKQVWGKVSDKKAQKAGYGGGSEKYTGIKPGDQGAGHSTKPPAARGRGQGKSLGGARTPMSP